jgi:hypothetical protein
LLIGLAPFASPDIALLRALALPARRTFKRGNIEALTSGCTPPVATVSGLSMVIVGCSGPGA